MILVLPSIYIQPLKAISMMQSRILYGVKYTPRHCQFENGAHAILIRPTCIIQHDQLSKVGIDCVQKKCP